MKIYTRTGDRVKTILLSGEKLFKDKVYIIRAYGEVDELNSVPGALAASLLTTGQVADDLRLIQSRLFNLCAWPATIPVQKPGLG